MALTKSFIWWGEIGIWQTLFAMKRLAVNSSQNDEFCAWAASLLNPSLGTNVIDQYTNFVKNAMTYVADPDEYEFVKDPVLLMNEYKGNYTMTGDCDDHVVLLSALFTCRGVNNAMIALALTQLGDDYNHVVNGIPLADGSYFILDCSMKGNNVAYDVSKTLKVDVYG